MEIRLSASAAVDNSKTIMAIVFQYPIGQRPPVQAPPSNNAVVHPIDRNNNNGGGASNNYNNADNIVNGGQIDERIGFLTQLLRELWSVFDLYTETPTRTPTSASASATSVNSARRFEMQDNHRSSRTNLGLMSREPSSTALLGPNILPDIIQCHRTSFSIDLSFESRTLSSSASASSSTTVSPSTSTSSLPRPISSSMPALNQEERLLEDAVLNRGSVELSDLSDFEESWTLEVKLAVGPWRQVGRDLRRVADQLQLESSIRRRSSPRRRSLEFRLVMRVAVPTIALVGLGYAFLRRHL